MANPLLWLANLSGRSNGHPRRAKERTRRQRRLIKAKAAPAEVVAASLAETHREAHTVAKWFGRAHAVLWTGLAKLEQALRPASGWRMW